MWAFGLMHSQTGRNRLTLIFCFAFCASACILLPTRSLDGDTDCGTTLLDFQRRPAPLSLGHADPHHYHWDTLFVKGKEMWQGAGAKPDAIRALKQVRKGDRVLCYHSAPERSLYSIAEVTRDPYADPHDHKGKSLVADLRAFEKLPRQVTLAEMRANPVLKKMKLLKNVRLIISSITDAEYQEILRMAGIVATPGIPLP